MKRTKELEHPTYDNTWLIQKTGTGGPTIFQTVTQIQPGTPYPHGAYVLVGQTYKEEARKQRAWTEVTVSALALREKK
jgi:hypothetical protein